MAGLMVLPSQRRACRIAQTSAAKLEHTGPAEKERVASVPQRKQIGKVHQNRPFQNEKEQSRLSRSPDRE